MLFVCHPKILHKHCLLFLLGVKMAPILGLQTKSIMVFLEWSIPRPAFRVTWSVCFKHVTEMHWPRRPGKMPYKNWAIVKCPLKYKEYFYLFLVSYHHHLKQKRKFCKTLNTEYWSSSSLVLLTGIERYLQACFPLENGQLTVASLKVNLRREEGDRGMISSQDSKGIFLNSFTF